MSKPDPICTCGHKESEHTGEDGMCKHNAQCDCGGFVKP